MTQFAEIILPGRFPKQLGIFDYRIPPELQDAITLGQLVAVPFRSSRREGVVIAIKPTSTFARAAKPIETIVAVAPVLTAQQIEFARWMAANYFVSIGTVLKLMLPQPPKRGKEKNKLDALPQKKSIAADKTKKTKYFLWAHTQQAEQQYLQAVIKSTRGQIAILVPEIEDIVAVRQGLPELADERIAEMHSRQGVQEAFSSWSRIKTGQATVSIGTKMMLFMPFATLRHVVVLQQENSSHKQSDQNPRFDARIAAEQLAQIHGVPITVISHAPTVTAYRRIQDGEYTVLPSAKRANNSIEIIDLRAERRSRNFRILSAGLAEAMQKTLAADRLVFLFLNKRGSASSVVCQDCGTTLTCQRCGSTLAYHEASALLFCHRCNTKSELPPFCPHCHGVNFRFKGIGTQSVAKEVAQQFPGVQSVRIDTDQKNISLPRQTRIIIGTERAFAYVPWDAVGLIGVVSADTLLHLPDYRATERTWQLLTEFTFRSPAPMVVQTYDPGHILFKSFAASDKELLYRHELKERNESGYPPFVTLVKCTFRNADKARCVQQCRELHRRLSENRFPSMIVTPLKPYSHQQWQMFVIMKLGMRANESELRRAIAQVPEGWTIERDPESIL